MAGSKPFKHTVGNTSTALLPHFLLLFVEIKKFACYFWKQLLVNFFKTRLLVSWSIVQNRGVIRNVKTHFLR